MRIEFLWSESKNPKLDRKRLTHRDGPSKDGHTGSWAPERANVALDKLAPTSLHGHTLPLP